MSGARGRSSGAEEGGKRGGTEARRALGASARPSSAAASAPAAPGVGTVPSKKRATNISARLIKLPRLASSSELLRAARSAHLKSVSDCSGLFCWGLV